ncbi:MAG: RNA-binding cell elongation regulator Jag/EloR [Aerococcus sp.]|nr:RNA-binding cell elongation regulator Jag/EloR [Aerococcus sp.]
METKIYEAKTIDEAIQKGLKDLNLTDQNEVEVTIVQEPRKGFLGLGEKKAIIQLSSKKPVEVAPVEPKTEETMTATESNAEATEAAVEPEVEVSPAVEETTEEEITQKVETPSQADAKPETEKEIAKEATPKSPSNPDIFGSDDDDDEEEQSEQTYDVDWVAHYIIDVMKNYLVDVSVDVEDNDDLIIYHINTDKPGLVIGKHGKIINALEVLAQVLTHRHVRSRVRVALNVGDYRERRHHILENLAERIADDVTMNQNTEYLDPLPARERKIVHQTLAKYQHIQTHSEGREPRRYLVVSYKD